jgi:hypothetical protein
MSWKLIELTPSDRDVDCADCGSTIPAAEVKVRLNPARKHDGKTFFYYHIRCFMNEAASAVPGLVRSGKW